MPPVDLGELYDHHANALFAFLLSFTGRAQDASDVLQELFVKLARHPDRLQEARDPRAYLIRLSHNLAIDFGRRGATRRQYHEASAREVDWFVSGPDPDRQAFQETLTAALTTLPPEQRAVVHLKLWEGLTFDAIADLLEIPLNTAASRYRYGLDKLRDQLRPLYEEQLRSLKFRTPPDSLRQAVLARAMAAGQADRQVSEQSPSLTLWQRLESWIWPGPRAWAALASLWVVAAILQYASLPSGSAPSVTASLRRTAVPESMKLALLEQRKLRAELLGSEVSRSPLPRMKPEEAPPRPRSSIELSEMSA